ncbi:S8 family serine peptidase [Sinorhizobium sojae]|nr:S8 family serine peptidase [Sinorhizobium sojae]
MALIALLAGTILVVGDMLAIGNPALLHVLGTSEALADDDDDDDDDDRGSSSARDGSGGRNDFFRIFRGRSTPRLPRRAPRRVVPLPTRAQIEIIGLGLTAAQLDQLSASGYSVFERETLGAFGADVVKLRIPSGLTLEAAREQAATLAPQAVVDFNHFYRPEQRSHPCAAADCLARTLIGWPEPKEWRGSCGGNVRIGLVDTAINPDHSAFEGANIEIIRPSGTKLPESGKQHGTAVAALLIGSAASRTPGLVPGGTLVAVDAFYRAKRQDDRADAYDLVRALDLLAGRKVHVVNLSLAGPANLLLEQAVKKVSGQGVIMVAAAGNKGPKAEPVYPAAYAEVMAVTATDKEKRPYRRAGRGEHIDFAAPGVAVWTAASISGARPKTGTSFAAPFVTAAAALMKAADPYLAADRIREMLTRSVEDLGDPGKDPVFGWGLLNARALCQPAL